MDALLDDTDDEFVVPAHTCSRFIGELWVCFAICNALRNYYGERNLFHTTYKFHHLIHIIVEDKHCHPESTRNCTGESAMKDAKDLVQKSLASRVPFDVPLEFLQKYAYAVQLAFGNDAPLFV